MSHWGTFDWRAYLSLEPGLLAVLAFPRLHDGLQALYLALEVLSLLLPFVRLLLQEQLVRLALFVQDLQ